MQDVPVTWKYLAKIVNVLVMCGSVQLVEGGACQASATEQATSWIHMSALQWQGTVAMLT